MLHSSFDPYHKWLGIANADGPPTHYQLLGIARLESDVDVIEYNTDRQLLALRYFETGPRGEVAKRISGEVSAASRCLLDPRKKKKYDQGLSPPARLPRPVVAAPATPPLPPPVHADSPTEPGRSDRVDTIAPDLITRSVVGQRLRHYRPARTRDRIISRGRKS